MVGTSSSSCSSCASLSSFDDVTVAAKPTIKFLCSYNGKILPRHPDGKLRYTGGETRVLSVDRSVTFSELRAKMAELNGWDLVNVRCQLPTEDLDALVSITCDEDLANLIEEYDLASKDRVVPLKIRAFLHASKPLKVKGKACKPPVPLDRCVHPMGSSSRYGGRSDFRFCPAGNQKSQQYLIHHGNHWQ